MTGAILIGDCREQLATLPAQSAHCCVTSPPYWGLRDYGVDGQIGLEQTPEEYVAGMMDVFREVWRVLRDDGTLWLNLGSSYASGGRESHGTRVGYKQQTVRGMNGETDPPRPPQPPGYKPKDLVPIPWLVAIALQQDGWYLRSDIIWAKPNPLPASVTDRPTCAHEYLFLLTKRARYYYDAEAVREKGSSNSHGGGTPGPHKYTQASGRCDKGNLECAIPAGENGRNLRTVWTIATATCPAAHFATYPEALVRPCILAGTSERGCCPQCGKPWERVVEKTTATPGQAAGYTRDCTKRNDGERAGSWTDATTRTVGWRPTCACNAADPVPCTVLDPFMGAGTTGLVAAKLQRNWIGCELNPEYAALAQTRIDHGGDMALVAQAQAGQARLLEVGGQ